MYEHLLRSAGVELVQGWATLCDAHTVQVASAEGARRWRARHILIATGGTPSVPHFPGREHVLTSDSMFDLEPFPAAWSWWAAATSHPSSPSIFHGLGASVTQLYRGEQILRGFDDDIRAFLAQEMRKQGVELRLRTDVAQMRRGRRRGAGVSLEDGSELPADAVLYATGRVPNVAGLGLDAAGVQRCPRMAASSSTTLTARRRLRSMRSATSPRGSSSRRWRWPRRWWWSTSCSATASAP